MNRPSRRRREPYHAVLAGKLRDLLAEGYAVGDRFLSQNELADRFDVAPNTAREAVGLMVQEGLLERRFGSGTYVRQLKVKPVVGVLTELDISHSDVSPFFPQVIQELRRQLAAADIMTRLYVGQSPPAEGPVPARITIEEFLHDVETNSLSGVIAISTPIGPLLDAVRGRAMYAINAEIINGRPMLDHAGTLRAGVEALADRGCRRVACVAFGKHGSVTADHAAFAAEASRRGMTTRDVWLQSLLPTEAGAFGAMLVQRVWSESIPRPDGLLVLDDMVYRALAPQILCAGIRIPGDLVIVSHVNPRDRRTLVPCPIGLAVDPYDVATALARLAIAQRRGDPPPMDGIPVPARLILPDTAP